MEKNIFKTEKFSIRYILISSFIIGLLLSFVLVSSSFTFDDNIEIDSQTIIAFVVLFFLFSMSFFIVFLFTNRSYNCYVEDGKFILKFKDKKSYEFELNLINKIYTSNSIFYKGITIERKYPKRRRVGFIVKKDDNFIDWFKKEIQDFKNLSPENEIKIKYVSYEKLFRYNLFSTLFIILNLVNITFLNNRVDVWINVIIMLVCMIGLIVVLIKMIKTLIKSNRKPIYL